MGEIPSIMEDGDRNDRVHYAKYNFRDYGDIAATRGARVARGLLFRSAELGRCEPHEASILEDRGIVALIDLRNSAEIPDTLPATHPRHTGTMACVDESDSVVPHAMRKFASVTNAQEAREVMTAIYRELVGSSHFQKSLKLYFEALVSAPGPTLVHCFAGKDRTGLAVALLQGLLGVHRDDVLADYLATNSMGPERERYLAEHLQAERFGGSAIMREVLGVRPEYLEAGLGEIARVASDPSRYLAEIAGVGPEVRQRITGRFLI